ncbi:MAG: hypothetical protein PWP28_258 [Oceanotoga sp.]|jgi:hypothetical protein|uniref:O-antigen ligase family protein n=1 Tax=Oceanotoga sp. TaxID=2108366 RepID=UPI002650B504|nr:O-antigen polymerase [Oceanotoga sp.]MDN5341383.1 hypothetical protein [Oceanotoga sp.]
MRYLKILTIITLIGFFWLPVLITGDDVIYLSELLTVGLFLLLIIFNKNKNWIKKDFLIMTIPIILFTYRLFIASILKAPLNTKEYFLLAKQIEFFMIFITFYMLLVNIPNYHNKIIKIIKILFFSYALFILADGVFQIMGGIRARIPFKPGTSSSLSGIFSSFTAYIYLLEFMYEKKFFKSMLYVLIILISLGAMVLTISRTAIFGFLITSFIFFITYLIMKTKKKYIMKALILFIVFLLGANFYLGSTDKTYGGMNSLDIKTLINLVKKDKSFGYRKDYYIGQTMEDNYGKDNFKTFINFTFGNVDNSKPIWDNQYVMWINNFGAVGIFLYIIYFFYFFRKIFKNFNNKFNMMFYIFMIHLLISGITLESFTNIYVFLHIFSILQAIFIYLNSQEEVQTYES